jgi:hypothetical protein
VSWTLTIPATKRACFEDAVDRARHKGSAIQVDIDAAKDAIKALAKRVHRPFIYAYACGSPHDDTIHLDVFGDPAGEPEVEWR